MKFKYIVAYENNSDKFDIGQGQGYGTLKFFSIDHNTNSHTLMILGIPIVLKVDNVNSISQLWIM